MLAAGLGLSLAAAVVAAAGPASAVSAPTPLERESPVYPKGAQKRGIEGWVLLEFTVDEHGDVISPRIIESSPPGVFDSAALKALTEWKYTPAKMGTTAVATPGLRVKLNFALKAP
jgi:protein TonB